MLIEQGREASFLEDSGCSQSREEELCQRREGGRETDGKEEEGGGEGKEEGGEGEGKGGQESSFREEEASEEAEEKADEVKEAEENQQEADSPKPDVPEKEDPVESKEEEQLKKKADEVKEAEGEEELEEDTQSLGDPEPETIFEEYIHDGYTMKWNKVTNQLLDPDDDEVLGMMTFDDDGNPKPEINVDDSEDDSDEEQNSLNKQNRVFNFLDF